MKNNVSTIGKKYYRVSGTLSPSLFLFGNQLMLVSFSALLILSPRWLKLSLDEQYVFKNDLLGFLNIAAKQYIHYVSPFHSRGLPQV